MIRCIDTGYRLQSSKQGVYTWKGRVALYGFGGGSGGSGAALTVNAPAGVTVTVSKDGKSENKTANSSGIAVFKGLSTGEWTVTITDGEKTASKPVTIIADFNKSITFFSATIHVTYPAGSKCTATDGVTTLKAPDTSGTWDCVVPNAGTWTITCTDGTRNRQEDISITTDGQSESVVLQYRLYLFKAGSGELVALTTSKESGAYITVETEQISCSYDRDGSAFQSCARNTDRIDLTPYGKFVVECELEKVTTSPVTKYAPIMLVSKTAFSASSTNSNARPIAYKALEITPGEHELDISSLTGDGYYVGFRGGVYGKITNMYLEYI